MQKSFKLILSLLIILTSVIGAFAQDKVEYKDVILNGKRAKLNVATGEIILVTLDDKVAKAKIDSVKTNPINVAESQSINASDFHIVEEGENLLDVSRKYKVSLNDLKQANNLETTLIDKGQKLRVRNFASTTQSELKDNSATANESYAEKNTSNFHVVKKGETLYSLSRRYNLSLNELKSKNSLNTNLIRIGQKLRVRSFGISNEVDNVSVWTVIKGDTLFSIAKKSGTTVDAIKQLNGLISNNIMIGQILQLK